MPPNNNTITRACTKCGTVYPRTKEFFVTNYYCKDGLGSHCRNCARAYTRQYRKNNPEKHRAGVRRWRQKYPEKVREYSKRQRKNNPLKTIESIKRWRKAHPDKYREIGKKWRLNHPERARIDRDIRRSRKMNAAGSYSIKTIVQIFNRQDGRCLYCGMGLNEDYHVDHYIPLSRGGTNYSTNLIIACPTCNLSKGDKLYEEWKASRGW